MRCDAMRILTFDEKALRTYGRTDQRTYGRTDPLIEMQSHLKTCLVVVMVPFNEAIYLVPVVKWLMIRDEEAAQA